MSFIFDDLLRNMFGGEKLQKLAAPVITYENDVVTMTGSGTIRYTTDGTTPTASSTVYTSGIRITEDTTFKAYCSAPGMADSDVTTYFAEVTDYSMTKLYIQNETDNAITVTLTPNNYTTTTSGYSISVSYSIVGGSSGTMTSSYRTVSLPARKRMYLSGANSYYDFSAGPFTLTCDGNFSIGGNVASMLNGGRFTNTSYTMGTYCLANLFSGNTNLISAENLCFPNKTSEYCYYKLLENCSNMVTAPATLPATSVSGYAYCAMFGGCSKMTTAPTLPASQPSPYAYDSLFYNCTKLNYIKCLSQYVGNQYTRAWVVGVGSNGTFVKKSGISWSTGSNGIPSGWTVQSASS